MLEDKGQGPHLDSSSDTDEEDKIGGEEGGGDVLGKLMGRKKRKEKPGIEVVGQEQEHMPKTPR